MRAFQVTAFGLENLQPCDQPRPAPGPGEVLLRVRAMSLNYRDLMVVRGQYNPKQTVPFVPISDAAGVIDAVGEGVTRVLPGAAVATQFIVDWQDGPFRGEYRKSTLGTPGPGMAAECVVLPERAVVPLPPGYDFAEGATLPIAALTAWSGLVTEGRVSAEQTVLTLGTGGVSIFALQIARALGARVIITSSSDEKLTRARALGATETINYRARPEWEKQVLALTGGEGADVTIETVGGTTLEKSLTATRAGGVVALLGVLAGVKSEINAAGVLMKRLKIAGIMVDSRAAFERMNRFLAEHRIRPVIDRTFPFAELPAALRYLESGQHFGKIVVTGA